MSPTCLNFWRRRELVRWLVAALSLQLVMITLATSAWAAAGTVSGTLVGPDGQPLPNVSIEIQDAQGATVATGTTDANGAYSVTSEALAPGVAYSVCSAGTCVTVAAVAAAAGGTAGMSAADMIAVGAGVAGAGAAIGVGVSSGGGPSTEGPISPAE